MVDHLGGIQLSNKPNYSSESLPIWGSFFFCCPTQEMPFAAALKSGCNRQEMSSDDSS